MHVRGPNHVIRGKTVPGNCITATIFYETSPPVVKWRRTRWPAARRIHPLHRGLTAETVCRGLFDMRLPSGAAGRPGQPLVGHTTICAGQRQVAATESGPGVSVRGFLTCAIHVAVGAAMTFC